MFCIDKWKLRLVFGLLLVSNSKCQLFFDRFAFDNQQDQRNREHLYDRITPEDLKYQPPIRIRETMNPRVKLPMAYLDDHRGHQKRSSWSTCTRRELCYCYSRVSKRFFCCDCDNGACFPSSSMINVKGKGNISMEELRIGDNVMTVSASGEKNFNKVLAFLDRRLNGEAIYLKLTTSNNRTVQLSHSHLIFVHQPDNQGKKQAIFAKDVKIGDQLIVPNIDVQTTDHTLSSVVKIQQEILPGAFVPITADGTIVVDGVLASCYTSFDHDLIHNLLAPIRWIPQLFETTKSQYVEGVRHYAKVLKNLGHLIFPHQQNNDVIVVRRPEAKSHGKTNSFLGKFFLFSVTTI